MLPYPSGSVPIHFGPAYIIDHFLPGVCVLLAHKTDRSQLLCWKQQWEPGAHSTSARVTLPDAPQILSRVLK